MEIYPITDAVVERLRVIFNAKFRSKIQLITLLPVDESSPWSPVVSHLITHRIHLHLCVCFLSVEYFRSDKYSSRCSFITFASTKSILYRSFGSESSFQLRLPIEWRFQSNDSDRTLTLGRWIYRALIVSRFRSSWQISLRIPRANVAFSTEGTG